MKGQLSLEYFVTLVFFIVFVLYIYKGFASNIPMFIDEIKREDLRAKAFQISEVLLNDPGQPVKWYDRDISRLRRVGLSDEEEDKANLISKAKIDKFNEFCSSDYAAIQDSLAIDEPFSVYIFRITNNGNRVSIASCEPPQKTERVLEATVRRITAYNDGGTLGLAEIIVQV